jgi:hypothetical protein
VADHRRIGWFRVGAVGGVAGSRFATCAEFVAGGGEPGMAGTACGDEWETKPFPAKTKPIPHVAGCERKALSGVGPRRISKTNLRLTTWQGFRNEAIRGMEYETEHTAGGRRLASERWAESLRCASRSARRFVAGVASRERRGRVR